MQLTRTNTTQLAKMSVDPKFVEFTADVLKIFLLNTSANKDAAGAVRAASMLRCLVLGFDTMSGQSVTGHATLTQRGVGSLGGDEIKHT